MIFSIRRGFLLAALLAVACEGDTSSHGGVADAGRDAGSMRDAGAPRDGGRAHKDAALEAGSDATVADARVDVGEHDGGDAARPDGSSLVVVDSGTSGATDAQAGEAPLVQIPGWSVRKRIRASNGGDLALQEVLTSFLVAGPGRSRLAHIGASGIADHSFEAPNDAFLTDFCVHPSGEISAVLVVGSERSVSLVRLDASLSPLSVTPVHDPEVRNDLPLDPPSDQPATADLFVNGLATDAARIAPVGEDVVFVVYSSRYSVIAYRSSYADGVWSPPARTLVEPPLFVTAFLPIGGSFDTFGAIVDWYRAYLDTDEAGNAYVAVWGHPVKITAHVSAFHDGLAPLHPEIPHGSDSDVIVTRLDRTGERAWSRVIGTENEDEPYAVRTAHGEVAVVGRSRRFFGNDNTAWDAFFSVVTASGALIGSRAVPLEASSILLAAAARPDGTWVAGGSEGWSQNPDGLSIDNGKKLVVEFATVGAAPVRRSLPAGPRHSEVRTLSVDDAAKYPEGYGPGIRYGGHEDGPSMHTGDADPTLISATGVIRTIAE